VKQIPREGTCWCGRKEKKFWQNDHPMTGFADGKCLKGEGEWDKLGLGTQERKPGCRTAEKWSINLFITVIKEARVKREQSSSETGWHKEGGTESAIVRSPMLSIQETLIAWVGRVCGGQNTPSVNFRRKKGTDAKEVL